MAASNPSGESQFWDSGFPFGGVKLGTNTAGEMQFWDAGFPSNYIFPSTGSSTSPSSSASPSISPSASVSPSASPSAGYTGYTREAKVALPTTTADLATAYSGSDITDVSTSNDVRVGITGGAKYLLHQYKNFITSSGAVTFTCELQSTVATSSSTVYLQIYNYNSASWETLTSNNSAAANTDFTLQSTVADMTNYKSAGIAVCRVYQLAP